MKELAAELEKEKTRGRGNKKASEELDLLAKLETMDPDDRALAERIHAIVTTAAPDLAPKLWYGQPAYALKGKVVCFFRSGHDDKERYSTLGFTQNANLDDGGFWPTSYAIRAVDADTEKAIATLVTRAVS